MTLDGCLTNLKTVIASKCANALELATMYIDELASDSGDDRQAAVTRLNNLQTSLRRDTKTSPLREDISDIIGSKILGLLETH